MRRPATQAKPAPTRAVNPGAARPRVPVWLLALSLVLVTIALFWPATSHDFVNYDDDIHVTANAHVQEGLTLERVRWAFKLPGATSHP